MLNSFFKGYNHPAFQKVMTDPKNLSALINRPALGWYPNDKWVNLLHDVFMSVAPKGMDQVSLIFQKRANACVGLSN